MELRTLHLVTKVTTRQGSISVPDPHNKHTPPDTYTEGKSFRKTHIPQLSPQERYLYCCRTQPLIIVTSNLNCFSVMASNLLQLVAQHPPNSIHTTPSTVLTLSRHAPSFLSSSTSKSDTPETCLLYENLFIICLRALDDKSAQICLDRLTERFGAENERVQALAGLYTEATSENRGELEMVLKQYEEVVKSDATNTVSSPRRPQSLLRRLPVLDI